MTVVGLPGKAVIAPPRRVTDEALRAPIGPSKPALPLGIAVSVVGLPSQAAVIRRFVHMRIGWHRREAEHLDLMVTELFTNALKHSHSGSKGGEVIVSVSKDGPLAQVKVIDQGPIGTAFPHLRPLDVEAGEPGEDGEDGGFGLYLITNFASRWGIEIAPGHTTVWFEVERSPLRRSA